MNVLLVDDHPMVNSGLAAILEETGRFKVTGQAVSLDEAKQITETSVEENSFPSVVILDITLGDENGLDYIPYLDKFCAEKKLQKPKVLICSVLEEPFRIQSALRMGASGYIPKTGSKIEILEAIATVLRGETYISDKHSDILKKSFGIYTKFTKRETQILTMIKDKKTNNEIAETLNLSIRTVENHISNIYFKTGTASRDDLLKL